MVNISGPRDFGSLTRLGPFPSAVSCGQAIEGEQFRHVPIVGYRAQRTACERKQHT